MRHKRRGGNQQQVEHHRHRHVEEEDRLEVLLPGRRAADERLREAAVDDHQRKGREDREDGDQAEILAREQAQHDDAHPHLEEHRTDLLADTPRHAAGDLDLQLTAAHRNPP